jgi:hypothetical protein
MVERRKDKNMKLFTLDLVRLARSSIESILLNGTILRNRIDSFK